MKHGEGNAKFTWIVIIKNFAINLSSQPLLGCQLGFHIFFITMASTLSYNRDPRLQILHSLIQCISHSQGTLVSKQKICNETVIHECCIKLKWRTNGSTCNNMQVKQEVFYSTIVVSVYISWFSLSSVQSTNRVCPIHL